MAHLRACLVLSLLVGLVVLGAWASPGAALEEADRLFLVGEKAFDDGLYPLSRRMLERFVERFPSERRAGEATLLLGKARLSQGAGEAALEAFKKAESFQPPPGKPGELRFWEAEAFYRLKRFSDARTAYSDVIAAGRGADRPGRDRSARLRQGQSGERAGSRGASGRARHAHERRPEERAGRRVHRAHVAEARLTRRALRCRRHRRASRPLARRGDGPGPAAQGISRASADRADFAPVGPGRLHEERLSRSGHAGARGGQEPGGRGARRGLPARGRERDEAQAPRAGAARL